MGCGGGRFPAATAAAAAARFKPWCLNCSDTSCSILKWCSGLANKGAGGTGPWLRGGREVGKGSLRRPPTPKGFCKSGGGSRWCLIGGGGPLEEHPELVELPEQELLELLLPFGLLST